MSRTTSIALRVVLCVLMLTTYLYLWRPVRSSITDNIVYPELVTNKAVAAGLYTVKRDGVAIRVSFSWNDGLKTTEYRPQAGFFFLLALFTLVLVSAAARWYVIIAVLHVASTLITALLMVASKDGWYPGFILADFIGTYLIPTISLALAVWITAREKSSRATLKKNL